MEVNAVKRSLEPTVAGKALSIADLPSRFYDAFVLHGLNIDLIDHGHVVCSMTVTPRLLNSSNGLLHSGVMATLMDVVGSAVFLSAGCPTSGVSLEISISFLDAACVDEEIEFDAKLLKAGKAVGACSVEIREKKTGKIVAQGRHSKYLAVSSKL
ncbi:hypothetical protein HPP92_005368 [Vanilla planifolia]|uniref:Acyl-coenzyme A thioesterase 13 n=1 Tax=Vanilla planifolia TaxID=51239 RepID=A0A835RMK4_VANPL|nr:hypothetical protein HPP92_005368 [Vanilla planifolia]